MSVSLWGCHVAGVPTCSMCYLDISNPRVASKRVATVIGGHPLNLGVVGRLDLPTLGLLCKITLMSELARKSLV